MLLSFPSARGERERNVIPLEYLLFLITSLTWEAPPLLMLDLGSAQVCSPHALLRPGIPNMLLLYIHNHIDRYGNSNSGSRFRPYTFYLPAAYSKNSRLLSPSHFPSLIFSSIFSYLATIFENPIKNAEARDYYIKLNQGRTERSSEFLTKCYVSERSPKIIREKTSTKS